VDPYTIESGMILNQHMDAYIGCQSKWEFSLIH
jgi:hypothetical protein